ncbi:MAG: Lrp/AsnC family transcriptional regulator [Candidatus Norongarragalinales archaeon]
MKTAKLDDKDRRILELLEENAGLTRKKMARKLGLPLTTVHNRIEKLKREGVITRFTVSVDRKKLGYGISAFVSIVINYPSKDFSQEALAKNILKFPEVEEVAIVAGTTDLIAKIHTRDTDTLNEFVVKKLRSLEGIDKTVTAVVMKEFKK